MHCQPKYVNSMVEPYLMHTCCICKLFQLINSYLAADLIYQEDEPMNFQELEVWYCFPELAKGKL
jgi:hypothetical protein